MNGSKKVLSMLNSLLASELTAMDIYLVQGRMFGDWGYGKLEARLVHEASDERQHADELISRILLLEGVPDVTERVKLKVGADPKEMLENDLGYELDVARALNEGIALSVAEGDNGTRALLEKLLKDTELDHIFWLQSQLKLIEDVGLKKYLAEQL